jgi:hypothetical protein
LHRASKVGNKGEMYAKVWRLSNEK